MAFENYIPRNQQKSTDPEPGPSMDAFKKSTRLFRERDAAEDAVEPGRRFVFSEWAPVLVLLAITGTYIWLEASWNVGLLQSMSDPSASPQDIDWMVTEGRWLAAFGTSWALLKSTFMKKADHVGSGVAAAMLIAGATVVGFAGIGRLYETAVEALPPAQSLQMYKTAVHRTWAVAGELKDKDASLRDPVAVALWPLKVADAGQAKSIERVFADRAENAGKEAAEKARQEWPEVQAKLNAGADPGEARKEFEELYITFKVMSAKTRSFFSSWQAQREQQMTEFTGFKPDPGATPEAFAQQLLRSRIQRHRDLGKLFLQTQGGSVDPVVYSKGSFVLKGSDFRNVKTEEDFVRMVTKKATNGLVANAPTVENVKGRPDAGTVIAAAMVPSMAMVMSCLGVLLNAGAFVGLLCVRTPVLRHIPQPAIPVAFLAAVLSLTPATKALPGLENGMAWLSQNHGALSWLLERVVTLEHLALRVLA
jgi:hypothetical protein